MNKRDKAREILKDAMSDDDIRKREATDIPYPAEGLSEFASFSLQPALTSRDERNMRSFDVHTGRLRGAQRAGLGPYGDGQAISNVDGSVPAKIDELASVMREVNPYEWSYGGATSVKWALAPRGEATSDQNVPPSVNYDYVTDIARDLFGTYYILSRTGIVQKVNPDGIEVDVIESVTYSSSDSAESLFAQTVRVDEFQNVFIAMGPRAGPVEEYHTEVHFYEFRDDGTYRRAWKITPEMFVLDMYIYGSDLFVWGTEVTNTQSSFSLRRYAAYGFDEAPEHDMASLWTKALFTVTGATDNDLHAGRIDVDAAGNVYATASRFVSGDEATTLSGNTDGKLLYAGLWKLAPLSVDPGTAIWEESYIGSDQWASGSKGNQGYGLGVIVCPGMKDFVGNENDRRIWVWGGGGGDEAYIGQPVDRQPRVRLVRDVAGSGLDWATSLDLSFDRDDPGGGAAAHNPSSGWVKHDAAASLASTGTPSTGVIFRLDQVHNRGAIDEDGRLYLPYAVPDIWSKYSSSLAANGTDDHWYYMIVQPVPAVSGPPLSIDTTPDRAAHTVSASLPTSVSVPIVHPLYNDASIDATDHILVGGRVLHGNNERWVICKPIVVADGTSASLREIRTIAFSGGKVYRLNDGAAATAVKDEFDNVVSYSQVLRYTQAASGFGHIYYSDGLKYYDYNPLTSTVSELISGFLGEIPKRCRLIEVWRNRLVLARSDELPGTWHMSRAGDATDWNIFPVIGDVAAAVSGATAPAGRVPDSINAIVPYDNDLLWFGCDSSIWQLTGNPSSGEFDLITDEVGMSFGRPYCKDDIGRLWFFGSKGGLYTWDGGLLEVAKGKIRRRLRNINLSENFIRLVYNYADDGIHIFVCPFGAASSTPKDHYFYDKRTGAFHVDKFGSLGQFVEPTAAIVIDGDLPGDRAIVLGSGDGHLHRWGVGDDGVIPKSDHRTNSVDSPIDSYVVIGPIAKVEDVTAATLSELTVILAEGFSGVHVELFTSSDPERLGEPVWSSNIGPGRNAGILCRVSGDSIYLRLRNATLDQHWAIERAAAFLSYGGRIR